jgi:hypothetical protein
MAVLVGARKRGHADVLVSFHRDIVIIHAMLAATSALLRSGLSELL